MAIIIIILIFSMLASIFIKISKNIFTDCMPMYWADKNDCVDDNGQENTLLTRSSITTRSMCDNLSLDNNSDWDEL